MTTSHYILVADDEIMVRRFLVRVVQSVAPHMHVIEASDGTEALAALQQYTFTAVLTDYHMPGATGLRIVETAHAQNPALPIIVVSAHVDMANTILAAGATYFLPKPATVERLTAILRAVLPTS